VLQLAARVCEAKVNKLDVIVLHQFHYIIGHKALQFISCLYSIER